MSRTKTGLGLLVVAGGSLLWCASCAGILGIDDLPASSSSGLSVTFAEGSGQSGKVGAELTLVAEVRDATGAPSAQRTVKFAATAGGGHFRESTTVTTDPQGRAPIHWLLGPAANNEIRASVDDVSARATATVTDPWKLAIFAGQPVGRMFRDGKAADARFGDPDGLAVALDGKVYIGDTLAHSVRCFDPTTKEVTTFAGANGSPGITPGVGPAARLTSPFGLARDGSGGLLVTSTYAHLIERIHLDTADVSFLAGTGESGGLDGPGGSAKFNSPYAIDVDAERNVAYVIENGNHDVREIDLATRSVRTIAGKAGYAGAIDGPALDARFAYPMGITHVGRKIYISDRGNGRLRVFDLDAGTVSKFSGVGPNDEAFGYVDGDAATARFNAPAGMTHANGFLYVADRNAHAIRKVSVADGSVVTIAGFPPSGRGPRFGAKDGAGADALLFQPHGIAAGPGGGFLYVTEAGATALRRVELEAPFTVTTVAAKAVVPTDGDALGEAVLDWPRGLALAQGKLVIAENQGNALRELDLATKRVRRFAGPNNEQMGPANGVGELALFGFPTVLAVNDAEGAVYVAGNDQLVRRVTLGTGEATTIAGVAWARGFADGDGDKANFVDPGGFAFDAASKKLYLTDTGNHRVRVIDLASANRSVSTVVGSTAGYRDGVSIEAHFAQPRGLVLRDKWLYVADTGNHVIRRIELAPNGYGSVTTIAGAAGQPGYVDGPGGEAKFRSPGSLALEGDFLYVADIDNGALRRIHLPTGNVSTLVGGPTDGVEPGPVTMPKRPAHLVVRAATDARAGEVLFTTHEENVVFRLGPP